MWYHFIPFDIPKSDFFTFTIGLHEKYVASLQLFSPQPKKPLVLLDPLGRWLEATQITTPHTDTQNSFEGESNKLVQRGHIIVKA